MNALPNIYLTWDPSVEPLDTFLRYQVYRRIAGASEWSKLARITDRGVAFYVDYTAGSALTYQYAVTQVRDVAGEEVESAFPTPVEAALVIRSVFIHDVSAPENYVELAGHAMSTGISQEIVYKQVWSRRLPTAHVGNALQESYDIEAAEGWDESAEVWRALRNLIDRQRTTGAVLMARQYRDVRLFGVIESPSRMDDVVLFRTKLRFRERHYTEEVD